MTNNNINNSAPTILRFSNLRNLFTLISFIILALTLVISFSVRWYIVKYFNYDLSHFKDLFIIGSLVSFIRPLVQDVFDVFYPKLDISFMVVRELPDQSSLTSVKHNERGRRTYLTKLLFKRVNLNLLVILLQVIIVIIKIL